jgi:tripartite motif-containing protein 71
VSSRVKLLAAAVLVTGLAMVGCADNTLGPTRPGGSGPQPSTLPNPLEIIARYTAEELGLMNPQALTVGPDGVLYVTEAAQRVSVISPNGQLLRRWGRPGSGPGEFKFVALDPAPPTWLHAKIAVGADGSVFVSDSGNYRVQVFSSDGRFARQFGSFGNGKGQFLLPFDLVVDGAGNAYVLDDRRTSEQLAKYSPSGQVVWQLNGGGDPDFVGHLHMASIDVHGRLVMVNDDNGRVIYLSTDGHKVDAFGEFSPGSVCEVTVDQHGATYLTGCIPSSTRVYDRVHRLIAEWPGSEDPLRISPVFGPTGDAFALGWDGSILKLRVTLA